MGKKSIIFSKIQKGGLTYEIINTFRFKFLKYYHQLKYGHFIRKKNINNYLKNHKIRKLHLGCARIYYKDFLNTDIFGKIPLDITKKLPFKNNTFDLIYSCHVIEHIFLSEFVFFLNESLRILKEKGVQVIQTPSLEKVSRILYQEDDYNKEIILEKYRKRFRMKDFFSSLYFNNLMNRFGHRHIYDFDLINYLAKKAGYKNVVKLNSNFDVPNEQINKKIKKIRSKAWNLETETFLFFK